jgi:ER membrane protein complex subunit 2
MSVDLAHAPPHASNQTAVHISQVAPKFLKNTANTLPWPLSLLFSDESTETWASYETLFMQCLRTGDDESAKLIVERMVERFGDRNDRIQAYQGMWEEAMAQDDEALMNVLEIYGKLLERDPTNMVRDAVPLMEDSADALQPVQKRRIALIKSMGNVNEAITQLTGLLKFSPTDAEAWAELSDLYLSPGMVDQAIFCLEEVLLIQPHAWNV